MSPLLGRALVPEDERASTSPVVVIGYDVWRSRFSADPAVLRRTIRLDDRVHAVVGVMPEGFAFPVNHRFWTPLRADRSEALPSGDDGSGAVFARLAPGGSTWTALVVIQIAFSVAALPTTVEVAWGTVREGVLGPGFAAEEYLTARLEMDRETPAGAAVADGDRSASASRFGAGGDLPGVIAGATLFMMIVGLLAAAGPARRCLRVEPTEALREG